MLSQIGLIHLFYSPYYYKVATGFLLFSSLLTMVMQLASLADNCLTHWFELFYQIPLILYFEHL